MNGGINNKTLAKILDGKVPHRLDALYRLCDGLKISIQEALIATTSQIPARPVNCAIWSLTRGGSGFR